MLFELLLLSRQLIIDVMHQMSKSPFGGKD